MDSAVAIVLNLQCAAGHAFEGWFGSAEDCDAQQARGLLSCPVCANGEVKRMPSAPRIQVGAPAPDPRQLLRQLRSQSEDVGERFAEEARRIHHGKAPERAIRGQASLDETRDLLEEGIAVLPLPALSDDSLH
ncbi:MAG: DUF1178 family protein [Paucibacter sp.]|nr:DUF1178 family protein [Roseateles sp.]